MTATTTRLDHGKLDADVPVKSSGESVVLSLPDLAGQSEPIPPGDYSFPRRMLASLTHPEAWSLDPTRTADGQFGAGFGRGEGPGFVTRGSGGESGSPVRISGRFWRDRDGRAFAQFSRVEWAGDRFSWVDCRVVELDKV
jgi:hypothetical protein